MEKGNRVLLRKFTTWQLLIYCAMLMLLAICMEGVSANQLGTTLSKSDVFWVGRYVIGFVILVVVSLYGHYLIDWLAEYPGWAYLSILGVSAVAMFRFLVVESYLCMPLFVVGVSLLIYWSEGIGFWGLVCCCMGGFPLILISFLTDNLFYGLALLVVTTTLLCYAALAGWFGHKIIYFFVAIGMGLATLLAGVLWQLEYLLRNMEGMLHPELDPLGSGYRPLIMQSLLRESAWFGQGGLAQGLDDVIQYPFYESAFLAFLSNHFGLWVFIAVVALFLGFFYLCLRKAHPLYGLPRVLALAIITYLMMQTIAFFAQNMGFPLFTSVPLPFISYSPHIWSNSLLCGLLLAAMGMKSNKCPQSR